MPGLGRRYSPDPRDAAFPLRKLIPTAFERVHRYWNANGYWGNQGETPQCVGYAWAHWIEDGPVTHRGTAPIVHPTTLYDAAQRVDEWPGEDYDGTSVRAGAKSLKNCGYISAYHWAANIVDVVDALLWLGPLVVGTAWYDSMFYPDKKGFLEPGNSQLSGGHAYVLDGVNQRGQFFRMKNSWGRTWGHKGFALISFDVFEKLLRDSGEACIATEVIG